MAYRMRDNFSICFMLYAAGGDVPMSEAAKLELVRRVERMVGYVPVGLGDLLSVLVHPDVISLTRAYLNAQEPTCICPDCGRQH